MGVILDGKACATKIKEELKNQIAELYIKPHLVVITTTDDEASKVYVRNKKRACEYVGMGFTNLEFKSEPQSHIEEALNRLNNAKGVSGVIIQLPLRKGLDECKLLSCIDPQKDVDNFHPLNLGLLMRGMTSFSPCTPKGIMRLLDTYGIGLEGKLCVIIGRSNIVGKPLVMELLKRNATPVICHSHTKNLKDLTKQADIVISATGQAKMITSEYIKEGAVLVDVGISRDSDGKLCGDIDPSCYEKSSYYTPVPNGVGQMTVAMLLVNCYEAYRMGELIHE